MSAGCLPRFRADSVAELAAGLLGGLCVHAVAGLSDPAAARVSISIPPLPAGAVGGEGLRHAFSFQLSFT